MTTYHVAQSIEGCLRNNPIGAIDFIQDSNSKTLSDTDARIELNKLLEQGYKLIPTSDDCVGFDPVSGCPGHEPLTGSGLTRAMYERGDLMIMCKTSNISDDVALRSDAPVKIINRIVFYESLGNFHYFYSDEEASLFAVPINNMGEPLAANDVGL